MGRYRKENAVNGRWSRWVQPVKRGYKFCCCDCGLVHDMDFRIEGNRVQFRAARNNRSTGQVRRHRPRPCPAQTPT